MSTKPTPKSTSSAPRPILSIPKPPKPPEIVHAGKVSLDGTSAKDGWKHK